MPRGANITTGNPRLSAGLRDKLVKIEALAKTSEPGFPVESWEPLYEEYMSRMDVRANERLMAHQPSAFVETIWQMPYREDMDPDVVDVPKERRLVYRDRVYDITVAVMVDRRGIELMTLAKSGGA